MINKRSLKINCKKLIKSYKNSADNYGEHFANIYYHRSNQNK